MADQTVVHIGENSPEEVAYKLMSLIRRLDETERDLTSKGDILDLYAECITAVRDPHLREK